MGCTSRSKEGLLCDQEAGHEDDHRHVTTTANSTTTVRWFNRGPEVKDVLASLDRFTKVDRS